MWPWLLGTSGGLIFFALFFATDRWHKRRRFRRLVERHACPLCHTPFAEAMYEVESVLGPDDFDRLDRFQRRFAACKIHCLECGGTVYCSDVGEPMKAVSET